MVFPGKISPYTIIRDPLISGAQFVRLPLRFQSGSLGNLSSVVWTWAILGGKEGFSVKYHVITCSPQPGSTLLHTYNRHDHDDDDDHDDHHDHHQNHHQNHHLYLHEGSKFATPSEQYVDWGNNINFIFIRDQNSPPPMNNMLIGVITSTLSSWGIKIRHPLWTICWPG